MSELPPLNSTLPASSRQRTSQRARRQNKPLTPQTMKSRINNNNNNIDQQTSTSPGIFDNTQFSGTYQSSEKVSYMSIRPQTARLDPLRFGLSSGRIRPARETWSQLTNAVSEFNEYCGLDSSFPSFMEQFSYVTEIFKHFNHYAIIIFNSIHPTDDPRAGLTTTPIHKYCRSLIIEWTKFIKIFNKIGNSKIGPVFRTLLRSIEKLSYETNQVARLFGVGTVKSDVKPSTMKMIDHEFNILQALVRKRIRDEESDNLFLEFDIGTFVQHANKLTREIQRLFTRSMPRRTSMTGEIMLKKVNLNMAFNDFIDLANGISNFDVYVNSVRFSIINMNNAFIDLFKTLNQPYDLLLSDDGSILQEPEPILSPKQPHLTSGKALPSRAPRRINH